MCSVVVVVLRLVLLCVFVADVLVGCVCVVMGVCCVVGVVVVCVLMFVVACCLLLFGWCCCVASALAVCGC